MTLSAAQERGRSAFDARAWVDAYDALRSADGARPLCAEDLERAAAAAYLSGHDDAADTYWTRAYQAWLARDEQPRAGRCGFWLSLTALLRGDVARSAGWLARTQRVLGDTACAEQGYQLLLAGLHALASGDAEASLEHHRRALAIGEERGEPDLTTLARLSLGDALVKAKRVAEGMRLLDEVMVAVTAGEVSPIAAGITYCAVIVSCQSVMDLRRATEWTEALGEWCASQPGLMPFRGQCLVHRSELLQLHGRWPEAVAEADRACEVFSPPASPGLAFYQRAELHRLWGEFDRAEAAYRQAAARALDPQPGLSLLRLDQGRKDAAASAIRRALAAAQDVHGPDGGRTRAQLLPSYVEIMLAVDDVAAARKGAEELDQLAARLGAPLLRARAEQAMGAVLLAENDTAAAVESLTDACRAWQELGAPYDMAKVRALLGVACRGLGDHDTGQMHLDAARSAFRELGAQPDLVRLERLVLRTAPGARGVLSDREVEVLRLVASGRTNRAVADALCLSEKTVARHVSNILTKLGLSSRSAATAYAYEHDLV